MLQEIELKLAISPQIGIELPQYLEKIYDFRTSKFIFWVTPIMIIPIIFLLNKKMGLRIRQEDQELTLTLKTNGKVVGGLHSRPEYNLPLTEKKRQPMPN